MVLEVSDRIAWIRDGRLERYKERDELNIEGGSISTRSAEVKTLDVTTEPGEDVIVSARGVKRLYKMGEEKVWAFVLE